MLPRTLAAALRDVNSDNEMTRVHAVYDLAGFPLSDEIESALLRAAMDASVRVRESAMQSLVTIGSSHAADVARHAFCGSVAALRFQALITLANVGAEDSCALCMRGLDDEDAEVRYIALRLVDDESLNIAPASLDEAQALRSKIERLCQDAAARVRLAAAIFLSKTAEGAWTEVLVELATTGRVAGSRVPEEDAAEAMKLLANSNQTQHVELVKKRAHGLRSLLGEASLRRAARAALQSAGKQ